jgi:hypothetical protein
VLEQMLNSQAQILQSEEVVRRTIRAEGAATLFPRKQVARPPGAGPLRTSFIKQ